MVQIMATLLLCTAWREIQRQRVFSTFDLNRAKSNPNSLTVSLCTEYENYFLNVSCFIYIFVLIECLICSFYEG